MRTKMIARQYLIIEEREGRDSLSHYNREFYIKGIMFLYINSFGM